MTRLRETERQFLGAVVALAQAHGWTPYHSWISIRSTPGFPDLVLVKPGHPVIYAELKMTSGRVTPAQESWLELLRQARGAEVYIWRPEHWSEIEDRLKG